MRSRPILENTITGAVTYNCTFKFIANQVGKHVRTIERWASKFMKKELPGWKIHFDATAYKQNKK